MKKYIFVSLIFLISSFIFPQTDTLLFKKAYPIVGWDSLRSIIERPENYPKILQRAGISGSISLSILIDSTGTLIKVEPAYNYTSPIDSTIYKYLIPVFEKILNPIKWHPSYKNYKPITDKIYRSFSLILVNDKDRGFNILAPKFYESKSH